MTNEQINAAIAEAINADPHWKCAKDYCTDLNAMHEAEKVLTKDRNSYLTTLAGLVEVDHLRGLDADWPWVCATARQRAEAFLKTVSKWEVQND
jgi:hypothetical protein